MVAVGPVLIDIARREVTVSGQPVEKHRLLGFVYAAGAVFGQAGGLVLSRRGLDGNRASERAHAAGVVGIGIGGVVIRELGEGEGHAGNRRVDIGNADTAQDANHRFFSDSAHRDCNL